MNRTLGFYLNDAGHAVIPANSVCSPTIENHSQEYALSWERGRVLQEFQVVYISKGKGVFQSTQGELIPINAGDAFLLYPEEWHRYRPDPEVGWTEFWINFGGDYAKKLMSSESLSPLRPIVQIGHSEALFQLFNGLAKMVYSKPFFNPRVAAAQAIQILAHLATPPQKPKSRYGEQIVAALRHISEQTIDYNALARKLGMSYSLFRREFQKVTELPPGQYQNRLRLKKAKELLCETSLSIGKIMDRVGFNSIYFFPDTLRLKLA